MKKIFTLITILVTLSLIGIIIIQVSWIKNMLVIKREQVQTRLGDAMFEVVEELVAEKSRFPSIPSPKLISEMPKDEVFNLMRAPVVYQRYTPAQIQRKLRRAFEKHGVKNIRFEFAVIPDNNILELGISSQHFQERLREAQQDTLHSQIAIWPLEPMTGSETESIARAEQLYVVLYDLQENVYGSMGWMIAGAILFTLIILAAFFLTVRTMLMQKKISEIKSDFINNMTHELKTPISTISIAVDALKNEKVQQNKEAIGKYCTIIKDENNRMNLQVERILQAALLNKDELKGKLTHLSVHHVLASVVESIDLQLKEIGGEVKLSLQATNDTIEADPLLFTNMLSNVIENAVKYRKADVAPVIQVTTSNLSKKLRIEIEDNGIGMNKETLSRIFEKFYRAHTGNVHNVKGFGLGLSYVKSVVDAHHGRIKAESAPGKGSKFILEFPVES